MKFCIGLLLLVFAVHVSSGSTLLDGKGGKLIIISIPPQVKSCNSKAPVEIKFLTADLNSSNFKRHTLGNIGKSLISALLNSNTEDEKEAALREILSAKEREQKANDAAQAVQGGRRGTARQIVRLPVRQPVSNQQQVSSSTSQTANVGHNKAPQVVNTNTSPPRQQQNTPTPSSANAPISHGTSVPTYSANGRPIKYQPPNGYQQQGSTHTPQWIPPTSSTQPSNGYQQQGSTHTTQWIPPTSSAHPSNGYQQQGSTPTTQWIPPTSSAHPSNGYQQHGSTQTTQWIPPTSGAHPSNGYQQQGSTPTTQWIPPTSGAQPGFSSPTPQHGIYQSGISSSNTQRPANTKQTTYGSVNHVPHDKHQPDSNCLKLLESLLDNVLQALDK